jgi:hypothetical protein
MKRFVVGFGRFWWDFIVGDDWKIAAGVVLALSIGAILAAKSSLSDSAITVLSGAGIFAVVSVSIVGGAVAANRGR